MLVAGMAAHSDIQKAHEVANEMRRVHKQLKEAQGLAQIYNNRERLFGMPVTNVCIKFKISQRLIFSLGMSAEWFADLTVNI